MVYKKLKYSLLLLFIVSIGCINEYNPFEDLDNVKHRITFQSFENDETINIFSAETVTVAFSLKEKIESFKIEVEGNRFWKEKTFGNGDIPSSEYSFIFSFNDTGQKDIKLTTHRPEIEPYFEKFTLHVKSPVVLDSAKGTFGLPCTLSTGKVTDPDALFYWDFVHCQKITSGPTLINTFTTAKNGYYGRLWVCDTLNNMSPVDTFVINMIDTIKPTIQGMFAGDTVKSGDSVFVFKVYIADYGGNFVDSASINNSAFESVNQNLNAYSEILYDMKNFIDTPFTACIHAIDNFGLPTQKSARDTFWVFYDSTQGQTSNTRINILNISKKEIYTQWSYISLFGNIESRESVPLVMKIFINGIDQQKDLPFQDGNGQWEWVDLQLIKDAINTIKIFAYDNNNNILDTNSVTIYHNSTQPDDVKPVIWEIKVDNKLYTSPSVIYTADTTANIKIIAYDNISGMKRLSVDSVDLTYSGLTWETDLQIDHNPVAKRIKIEAEDNFGNVTEVFVNATQNTLPYIEPGEDLTFPSIIIAESLYIDTLLINDNENDFVSINELKRPKSNFSFDSITKVITWKPQKADTGFDTLAWQFYNREYQEAGKSKTYLWDFVIKEKIDVGPPVKLSTTSADFPPYLEINKTPLDLRLVIQDSTGTRPILFTARITTLDTLLLSDSRDNHLLWHPTITDTGIHQLIISVIDAVPTRDTLFHAIQVVPENNSSCSLSVSCQSVAIVNDTLNLNSTSDTLVTLLFTIHDADHPLTENYFVTTENNSSGSSFYTDKKKFSFDIKPRQGHPIDTLVASIVDKSATTFKITLIVIHPTTELIHGPTKALINKVTVKKE